MEVQSANNDPPPPPAGNWWRRPQLWFVRNPVWQDRQLVQLRTDLAAALASVARIEALLTQPRSGRIQINASEPIVNIPDDEQLAYAVTYRDVAGLDVPENAPTTWSAIDLAGAPSGLATLTPDSANDQHGTGVLTAAVGSFKLRAVMGTLTLESDQLDITPGAPSAGVITVAAVMPAATPAPGAPPAPAAISGPTDITGRPLPPVG
jgi:hypothetical protein